MWAGYGTPEIPSLSRYAAGVSKTFESDLFIAYKHWYPTQGNINWGTLPRFTVLKDRSGSMNKQHEWLKQTAIRSEFTVLFQSLLNYFSVQNKTFDICIEKQMGEDFNFILTRGEFLALVAAMEVNSSYGNSPIATNVLETFRETHRGTILGDKLSIV